jgi:hypothetical protein
MSTTKSLAIIRRLQDIPSFANEAEEHAFWASHELSDELWSRAEPLKPDELPPARSSTLIRRQRQPDGSLAEKNFRTLLTKASKLPAYLEHPGSHGNSLSLEWNDFPNNTVLKLRQWAAVEYGGGLALLREAELAPAAEIHLRLLRELYARIEWIYDDGNGGTQRCRAICLELGIAKTVRGRLQKMLDEARPGHPQDLERKLKERELTLAKLHQVERCSCKPWAGGDSGSTFKETTDAAGHSWLDELWSNPSTVAQQYVSDQILWDRAPGASVIAPASFQQRAVLLDRLLSVFANLAGAVLGIANPSENRAFVRRVEVIKNHPVFQAAMSGDLD